MAVASKGAVAGGVTACGVGLTGLIAVASAPADSASCPWRSPFYAAVFAFSCLFLLGGVWVVSNYFFGWPKLWSSYEEKQQRKLEALRADSARRESFQRVLDELSRSSSYLEAELSNKRVRSGGEIDSSAWGANSHLLSAPEFETQREIVEEAYRQTGGLANQERERFEQVDQADLANPAWWALSEEESQARKTALAAVRQAWLAVVDVEMEEDAKRWKKWWQVWKR